jgi:hypothetical protein
MLKNENHVDESIEFAESNRPIRNATDTTNVDDWYNTHEINHDPLVKHRAYCLNDDEHPDDDSNVDEKTY